MLDCVIDTATGEVTFARAGHELPLIARQDLVSGAYLTHLIGSEGMPLGMVADEMFASVIADHTETFAAGDILVLYTDGVTEAPNEADKEFSNARLADAVRTLHLKSAVEINDGILGNVARFVGDEPQRDDLTLVTVKRT